MKNEKENNTNPVTVVDSVSVGDRGLSEGYGSEGCPMHDSVSMELRGVQFDPGKHLQFEHYFSFHDELHELWINRVLQRNMEYKYQRLLLVKREQWRYFKHHNRIGGRHDC